ncbi:MAG TPA: hypothetical protein PLO37_12490 [Candidatus Hydrogenedentes bacterium]|nr:hypothetical protein [Candidatus Hydrogenedentota bacterium]HPG67660.1 hypothetical protein [Candidatus Hydrogenedentota bacterium]
MGHGLAIADYLIVAGFFVVMLGIGIFFAGRMKSLKDFFGGGSRIPWWVSSVSLYMSTFSAFAFVAYSSLAYQHGFVAIFVWWMGVPCWILSARIFSARWRRAASTSPLEYIETRYGAPLRQGFAWSGVPLIVIDDALKLFVIGKMVSVSLGADSKEALLISVVVCGSIMLTYTFLGGLWAVMVTDFVQFIVMATAVIVLIPLVLARVGGLGSLARGLPEGFWKPTGGTYTWAWLIAYMPVQMFSYTTRWSLVQRYYAVRTDAEARKVGYLVAALTFIGVPFLFLPAIAARIFMPGIEDGNSVYPLLCKELLPVGMVGMMIAAMFSATMSMLSSDYNAVAAVLTNDVYKRLIGRNASERSLVRVGRVATLLIGLVALGVGLVLASAEKEPELVEVMARLFGVLLPPFAIPMMTGLLSRRVSNAGGTAGFLAGVVCGLSAYAASYLGPSFEFLRTLPYLTWITTLPTLGVMVLVSAFIRDSEVKRQQIGRFLDGLDATEEAPVEADDAEEVENKPAIAIQVIGLASAAIGAVLALTVWLTVPFDQGHLSMTVGGILVVAGLGVQLLVRKRRMRRRGEAGHG